MKYQILFSREKNKAKHYLSSAEFAQSMVSVNNCSRKPRFRTVYTLNIGTPYFLTILVLKFEHVNFSTFLYS